MVDESGFVRVWNISTGTFRLEMVPSSLLLVHPQCPDDNTPLHCMTISPDGESVSILSFFLSIAAHRLQQEGQRVHLEILEHRDSAASEVPRPRRIRAFLQGFHDKQVGVALEFEVERLLRRRPIAASSCGTWIRWRSRS